MRLSTGQRRVEMIRDYVGLREGTEVDLDAGVADVLVHRGFAKYAEEKATPERKAPPEPPKPVEPRRAVKQAKETRSVRPDDLDSPDDRADPPNRG